MSLAKKNARGADRISHIIKALVKKYPKATLALNHNSALELLIAVILSAQCTDERVNQVTQTLFKKYAQAKDYSTAAREQLEQDIRPTGFFRNKAKSLQACCQMLVDTYAGDVPQDIDDLVRLPGVGRKTAAMVLGNAFGLQQGIAVDTHVKRIALRTQISVSKTPEKIEKDLMAAVPRAKWTWFSNAMILHGRQTCSARKPKCRQCRIEKWCLFPDKTI